MRVAMVALAALVAATPAAADHSQLELVGVGPLGGNANLNALYSASTPDGQHVFFNTAERLVAEDDDNGGVDIYERFGGTTTLLMPAPVSVVPAIKAVSDDGAYVYLETSDSLTTADTDSATDVYLRHAGTTEVVSDATPAVDPNIPAALRAVSADGTHAVFWTTEQLLPSDTDTAYDLYLRAGGTTSHISSGPASSTAPANPFVTITPDGSKVHFTSGLDVWEWSNGVVSLVSGGCVRYCGNTIALVGASPDGAHVFVDTVESLVSEDDDPCQEDAEENPLGCPDIYDISGGVATLITPGTFDSWYPPAYLDSSADSSRVLFMSEEGLAAGTHPDCRALYIQEGVTRTYIGGGGESGGNCTLTFGPWGDMTPDGETVLMQSDGRLAPSDTDSSRDAFVWTAAGVDHASLGTTGGNANADVSRMRISDDGLRVVFQTPESLVPADTDSQTDVYERLRGVTYLVSVGPSGGNGPFDATVEGTSEDGTRIIFQTAERLTSADTDSHHDVYVAKVAPGYARPKGATPVFAALVPTYAQCPTPNRQHGPPLAFGSCAPPQRASSQLTVGTPDANGQPAKSIGSVSLYVIVGDPATPADEADVVIATDITDVRLASDLSDFTGTVSARIGLRLTDRAGADPQTLTNTAVQVPVSCAATPDTTIGARCTTTTTADAVVPGVAPEHARSIWALDQITVLDGTGAPFAVQGLFVP